MPKNIVIEGMPDSNGFNQQAFHSQLELEQKVKAIHKERIKVLQREMVEISLQNNQKRKIGPILEEIRKIRVLLSFSKKSQSIQLL